mmetsp:Transcript_7281/g.23300  ORF Transcript_7281/g.23300 Transcript_7281/m.23300 type:complete len:232 (+) Transcript_7281:2336-3031(+)
MWPTAVDQKLWKMSTDTSSWYQGTGCAGVCSARLAHRSISKPHASKAALHDSTDSMSGSPLPTQISSLMRWCSSLSASKVSVSSHSYAPRGAPMRSTRLISTKTSMRRGAWQAASIVYAPSKDSSSKSMSQKSPWCRATTSLRPAALLSALPRVTWYSLRVRPSTVTVGPSGMLRKRPTARAGPPIPHPTSRRRRGLSVRMARSPTMEEARRYSLRDRLALCVSPADRRPK